MKCTRRGFWDVFWEEYLQILLEERMGLPPVNL